MSNKDTFKETESLNEAREKAFKENNKIIDKLKRTNAILKFTTCTLVAFLVILLGMTLVMTNSNIKIINNYEEEMECISNKLNDTESNRQELIDILLDIKRYILPTCDANREMIDYLYNEIDRLASWEYKSGDSSIKQPLIGDEPYDNPKEIYQYIDKPEIYIYPDVDEKPEIYIYPDKDVDSVVKHVEIELSNPEKLTCTYPKYENSWSVDVKADGTLIWNNREYYGLYWEGKGSTVDSIETGFCVKGSDTAEFLEEKLEILGLSEREANEFIIYWLPRMESNKYNVIYFATMEEQDNYMKLNINPVPETLIRVNMVWYSSDKYIDIEEEKLQHTERKGYTVVEWGGTELKQN